MPPTDAPNVVARQLQFVCRWIVEAVAPLSEEQLRWQPHATAPSIRFHLFHIARCADGLQNYIAQGEGQLWKREGFAGLVADSLEHLSRHLGMIEALKGVQGLSGTATI